MSRTRRTCLAWLLALGALSLVGCGKAARDSAATGGNGSGGSLKRVILLTNGADPFWDAMRAGMQDAERDFKLADAGFPSNLAALSGMQVSRSRPVRPRVRRLRAR